MSPSAELVAFVAQLPFTVAHVPKIPEASFNVSVVATDEAFRLRMAPASRVMALR